MQRIFTLTLLFCVIASAASAQFGYTRYIVQLTDKKGTQFSLASPSAYLSQKAIDRRTKQKLIVDSTDLPVSKSYLDSIRAIPNVTVLNVSKWLNAITIQTTDGNAITAINALPFVQSTSGIAARTSSVHDK